MTTLLSRTGRPLQGRTSVPGDKSVSHRALVVAALAAGVSRLRGLSDSDDVARTKDALCALGVPVVDAKGETAVFGRGLGGLRPPGRALDFGNSGTGARLLVGALAAHDLVVDITGDPSLARRPMAPLLEPLTRMGAEVSPASAETLPFTVTGTSAAVPITYPLPAPSAQVKSAILLAGLNTIGTTAVIEQFPTRDHTEILLKHFGAGLRVRNAGRGKCISVSGWRELNGREVSIPGDLSAAAFVVAAALLVPGSDVVIENVGLNPTRTAFLKVLKRMGASLAVANPRTVSGEARGTLRVKHSNLRAVSTAAVEASALIDEFPALFVLAAAAKGTSRFEGLGALRVKESDRLSAMARALGANGAAAEISGDSLTIAGGKRIPGGGKVEAALDHRIAMAGAVLGLRAENPVRIEGAETIATSFPGFVKVMRALGADMTLEGTDAP